VAEHPNYDHICDETFTVGSQMFQVRRSTALGDANKVQPPYVLWHWDAHQERWIGAGAFLNAEAEADSEAAKAAWHSSRARVFDQVVVFSEETQR
jgi:hypothetical protein